LKPATKKMNSARTKNSKYEAEAEGNKRLEPGKTQRQGNPNEKEEEHDEGRNAGFADAIL
jgi:hypothetical protein